MASCMLKIARCNYVVYLFWCIGECIAGALEWKELMEIAVSAGFAPPVLVDVSPVSVNNPELKELLGNGCLCYYGIVEI